MVGALAAAEKYGIEFVGYGGASAGSIIALLGSLRYTTEELKKFTLEKDFSEFLDDRSGKQLNRIRAVSLRRTVLKSWSVFGDGILINRIRRQLGLYEGHYLEQFLLDRILEKYPVFENREHITFKDLRDENCKALKVIVSDVSEKKAIIYSAARRDDNEDVCRAVRASISFPFVFKPLTLEKPRKRYLVDGGLISNLPVFLFAREQKRTGYPVFAFDLVPPGRNAKERYRMRDFFSDLIATALEASDDLHRETISDYISNLFHIPINVPSGIDTLKFSISKDERQRLYRAGYLETWKTLKEKLPQLPKATSRIQKVQATLNIPVSHIKSLLKSLAQEVSDGTRADDLRAHVMLPIAENKLMVTYQFGMDSDTDRELIVRADSRWGQRVFKRGQPTLSDLELLRAQPEEWLDRRIVERIPRDRKTMFSVPIREQRRGEYEADDGDCIGVLSLDTSTPLKDTYDQAAAFILDVMRKWATIISRVIN